MELPVQACRNSSQRQILQSIPAGQPPQTLRQAPKQVLTNSAKTASAQVIVKRFSLIGAPSEAVPEVFGSLLRGARRCTRQKSDYIPQNFLVLRSSASPLSFSLFLLPHNKTRLVFLCRSFPAFVYFWALVILPQIRSFYPSVGVLQNRRFLSCCQRKSHFEFLGSHLWPSRPAAFPLK